MTETFELAPIPTIAHYFFVGLLALLGAIFVLFGWLYLRTKSTSVVVDGDNLRIDAAIYGRTIPLADLRIDQARVVDLRTDRSLAPTLRTNGLGLPGYQLGWFRLRSGERALLALVRGSPAVYLPTTKGYSLLLSPNDPHRFLETVREKA